MGFKTRHGIKAAASDDSNLCLLTQTVSSF
jgi:hypothetical protein